MAETAVAQIGDQESKLGGSTYRLMRVLSHFPQNERFCVTRLYGIGFPQRNRDELAKEMDLTPEEFEAVRKRAVQKLRTAMEG